jgi:hypothetical protein
MEPSLFERLISVAFLADLLVERIRTGAPPPLPLGEQLGVRLCSPPLLLLNAAESGCEPLRRLVPVRRARLACVRTAEADGADEDAVMAGESAEGAIAVVGDTVEVEAEAERGKPTSESLFLA